jgi:hypothetical protein
MRNGSKILAGKHEGKSSLGRHWCRWEDNIEIDLGDNRMIVDWIEVAQVTVQWLAP